MSSEKYFGKYRGTVVNNIDPEQRGRLIVLVPDVLGAVPSNWVEACIPFVAPSAQMWDLVVLPPVGTAVWVEFEKGDPHFPIWVGYQWSVTSVVDIVTDGSVPADGNVTADGSVPADGNVTADGSVPTEGNVATPGNIIFQTAGQHSIMISDLPGSSGGIILKSASGATIIVNDDGIYLQNGKGASFTMVGPSVTINNGALAIT